MPNWHAPTQATLHDAIGEALGDLNLDSDPAFEEVIDLSMEEITKHAIHAIGVLIGSNDLNLEDPTTLVQIYVLGFVVGTKYGEKRNVD